MVYNIAGSPFLTTMTFSVYDIENLMKTNQQFFLGAAKFDNKVVNEEKFCLCRFASYKEAYQANKTEQSQPVTTRA